MLFHQRHQATTQRGFSECTYDTTRTDSASTSLLSYSPRFLHPTFTTPTHLLQLPLALHSRNCEHFQKHIPCRRKLRCIINSHVSQLVLHSHIPFNLYADSALLAASTFWHTWMPSHVPINSPCSVPSAYGASSFRSPVIYYCNQHYTGVTGHSCQCGLLPPESFAASASIATPVALCSSLPPLTFYQPIQRCLSAGNAPLALAHQLSPLGGRLGLFHSSNSLFPSCRQQQRADED